jgi:PAP2 superfamily
MFRTFLVSLAAAFCLSGASAQTLLPDIAKWPTWLERTADKAPPVTSPNFDEAVRFRGRGAVDNKDIGARRWTRLTLDLIVRQRLNPLRAARVLVLVHAAMHDALVRGVAQSGDERLAWVAVHRAASLVLLDLFPQEPAERFEALGLIAATDLVTAESEMVLKLWSLGGEVAQDAAYRARRDGSDRVWPLDKRPKPGPGIWRATPPINAVNPMEPLVGEWRTWVLKSVTEVEPPPPPTYGSRRFQMELDEVRRVAAGLTPAQKEIAQIWNLDRGTVTPAGVWNLKALELATAAAMSDAETLRMLAATNVAMMDAFVACWHAKYKWWTVRPISLIRERYDPKYLSHLVTPPFPSYVSGHASASGAASAVLVQFFPAKAEWLEAQANEAAESRLYGGIHYRSDNEAGLAMGRAIGQRVLDRAWVKAR